MSATLNFNPKKYTSWKGSVFYRVSSFLKENNNFGAPTIKQTMKPLPLNIYRREIASQAPKNCNERVSLKIEELDRPNTTIVSENKPCSNGLVDVKTNDVTECVSKNCNINMPDVDARRRVRSAGMVRKKFALNKNNDTYCTSSNQYLVSRNRTFTQNQYNYIRQGNSSVKPGSALSNANLYSPNGISHCKQPYLSSENNNNVFSYRWIDGNTYQVVLPEGQYEVNELNVAFQNVMVKNTHHFVNNSNGTNAFLLNLSYDAVSRQVILQTYPASFYTNGGYSKPPLSSSWSLPGTSTVAFVIPATNIRNIIGFSQGTYAQGSQASNMTANITSNYVSMNYKPNNPQFGQQGAVSSSTLVARKKYDTITTVGAKMKAAYGSATANALAYGVSDHQYTLKDRMGYPMKKTPVISKYTGQVICLNNL